MLLHNQDNPFAVKQQGTDTKVPKIKKQNDFIKLSER